MKTPKKPSVPRITKASIMLHAHTANQEERDDQAIAALCFFLDRQVAGELSGLGSRTDLAGTRGELWSAILDRRIKGKYPKTKYPTITPSTWRKRHFWARQLAVGATEDQCAEYVAKVWREFGHRVTAETIKTAATRKEARDEALEWIDNHWKSTKPLMIATPTGVTQDAIRREAAAAGQTNEWIANMLESRQPALPDKLFYEELERAIAGIAKDLGNSKNVKGTITVF
jgi:uncharacterized protein YbdZ (MbtH family)